MRTFERLQAAMAANVVIHAVLVLVLAATQGARVRFEVRMLRVHVVIEVGLGAEGLGTLHAFERLFPCVDPDVVSVRGSVGQNFGAHFTQVLGLFLPLATVQLHVFPQSSSTSQGLGTQVT